MDLSRIANSIGNFIQPQQSQMPSPVPSPQRSTWDQLKSGGRQIVSNLANLALLRPQNVVPFTNQTDPGHVLARGVGNAVQGVQSAIGHAVSPVQNALQQAQMFVNRQTVQPLVQAQAPVPQISPTQIANNIIAKLSPTGMPIATATPSPAKGKTATVQAKTVPANVEQFKFSFGQPPANAEQQLKAFYSNLNNPPLAQFIPQMVAAGQKYGVDPRILAYIGQIESSGGQNYPTESYNPFGYLVNGGGVQGLKNAGFTSIPHAIDALTHRFANQRFPGYVKFREDPTISNLQMAYNANPAERDKPGGYMDLAPQLLSYFGQ